MSQRCGDCRHWGKPDETEFEFRSCVAVAHDADHQAAEFKHQHLDDDEREENRPYRQAHKAVVEDGSGFYAALRTREDFGCVLFEVKS